MSRRRGRHRGGPPQPEKPDYPAMPEVNELESGTAVGYDALPPNSYLLGLDKEDEQPIPGMPEMRQQAGPAPAEQLAEQDAVQAFMNYPPPPMKEAALTAATDEVVVETSEPPKGPDHNPEDQKRLTWMIDKIEIGTKRFQGRLVPDIKVRAALTICSYMLKDGFDPTNRAKKQLVVDVAYLTQEPITLSIPLLLLPPIYRANPSKLTTQIVEKILTSIFATFPCETVRPLPLPTALTYMPPAMREQLLRNNGLKMKEG